MPLSKEQQIELMRDADKRISARARAREHAMKILSKRIKLYELTDEDRKRLPEIAGKMPKP